MSFESATYLTVSFFRLTLIPHGKEGAATLDPPLQTAPDAFP